jgi:hypothetical protein
MNTCSGSRGLALRHTAAGSAGKKLENLVSPESYTVSLSPLMPFASCLNHPYDGRWIILKIHPSKN